MSGSTRARLLVATPEMGDPNFSRTVLLMVEHNEDGALGLVLNRQLQVSAADAVPPWADLLEPPGMLHSGGPVSEGTIVGLGLAPEGGHPCVTPLLGPIGLLDLHADPAEAPGVSAVRLFAGYAGWSAGQLEVELAVGSWFVLEAQPADVTTADPEGLWSTVLARQAGLLGQLAVYPDDPTLN
ncbi:MAG: hypothetical protein MAG471_00730 [Acidimicrobiaceae bacterium]|nr:hypothetical protein [Acidimicrobiaceae bacterium]